MGHNIKYSVYKEYVPYGLVVRFMDFTQQAQF